MMMLVSIVSLIRNVFEIECSHLNLHVDRQGNTDKKKLCSLETF